MIPELILVICDKIASVFNLQNQQATQISALKKGVLFGGNLIPNSDFAYDYDGWSMHNWWRLSGLVCGFNLVEGTNYYNLKGEKVFWVKDTRPTSTYNQTASSNNGARFAVKAGEYLQFSALVAGKNFQQPAVVYADFFDASNRYIGGGGRKVDFGATPSTLSATLDGMTTINGTTTLDRFHTCYHNVEVPQNAAWAQIVIRFRFLPNTEGMGLFARPQACVISSLDAGYVPYQISTWGYGDKLKVLETDNASNKGTIASLEARIAALESKAANGTIGD